MITHSTAVRTSPLSWLLLLSLAACGAKTGLSLAPREGSEDADGDADADSDSDTGEDAEAPGDADQDADSTAPGESYSIYSYDSSGCGEDNNDISIGSERPAGSLALVWVTLHDVEDGPVTVSDTVENEYSLVADNPGSAETDLRLVLYTSRLVTSLYPGDGIRVRHPDARLAMAELELAQGLGEAVGYMRSSGNSSTASASLRVVEGRTLVYAATAYNGYAFASPDEDWDDRGGMGVECAGEDDTLFLISGSRWIAEAPTTVDFSANVGASTTWRTVLVAFPDD